MPFDQSTISDVRSVVDRGQLWIAWDSTAPAGTTFVVFVDGSIAWSGVDRRCVLPPPRQKVRVDVGTIAAGETPGDVAGSPPAQPARRARLTWPGSVGAVSYRVHQSPTAGAAADMTKPVATVRADLAAADGSLAWTSPPLGRGVWTFAVAAVSAIGDEGAAVSQTVTIDGPPNPPARDAAGDRLTYAYDPATGIAVLSWLAPEA